MTCRAWHQAVRECREHLDPLHAMTLEMDEYLSHYRGVGRDPVQSSDWKGAGYVLAELRLRELEQVGAASPQYSGLIFQRSDAEEVVWWFDEEACDREVIWVRMRGSAVSPPDGYLSLGFEPVDLYQGCYSACFHGLSPDYLDRDVALQRFAQQLNTHRLFDSVDRAELYLTYFSSLDWTEEGNYTVVEVFCARHP